MTNNIGIQIHQVCDIAGSEAFLMLRNGHSLLWDSGFAFGASSMISNIESVLNKIPLEQIILSHSHYDHASGSAYCKKHWPKVKVYAHPHTATSFARPRVIQHIRELTNEVAPGFGIDTFDDELDHLHVDICVKEGDIIEFADLQLEVIEAPGHTRDCIALWCEQLGLLFSCETMGVYAAKRLVMPAFLIGYQASIDFIKRSQQLPIKHMMISHYGLLSGSDAKNFVNDALFWTKELARHICAKHKMGADIKDLIEEYRKMFVTDEVKRIQPSAAFTLNASYTIPLILKECYQEY